MNLDLHEHFVCMIIIQSEACSITAESLETPQFEIRIEEIGSDDAVNNEEQEVVQIDVDTTHHRLSIISDTDYNASAESNNSSRRSSIDVPQFEFDSVSANRDRRRRNDCDDCRSEVGRL